MPANRKRLTETTVINLPTKRQPYRCWDAGADAVRGLHVLVQPTGTRSYRVGYRFKGSRKEHALLIGRVGEITLSAARAKALEVRQRVAAGADPSIADVASDTFKAFVETWTVNEQQGRKECVSAEDTKKFLLTATTRWHNRQIATLHYAEIDDLLCAHRKRAPYAANRVYAHLKTLFKWAVRTKRLPASPIAEMPLPWLGAKPRSRSWFEGEAADAAIKKIWQCADQFGGDRGKLLKLLLITGKRSTAVATMRWEHIDSSWYWKPAVGTKNKRCHATQLPRLAQRIISPRGDRGRVLDPIRTEALAIEVRRMTGIDDFLIHGIRHVAETKLGELKVLPHVRDMLFDHAPARGAGKGYDYGSYRAEMLEALELWCSHIERLVQPSDQVAVLR